MFVATDASPGYDFKSLIAKIDSIPYLTLKAAVDGIFRDSVLS